MSTACTVYAIENAVDVRSAVAKINRRGALLVYPIKNSPEPASLWSEFHPKTKMRWEWDETGDDRVADLWRLRERVSKSGKAVYAKWYQARATFFSREIFPYLVAALGGHEGSLSPTARKVLKVLEEDSPLSTKELKKRTGLVGKDSERTYDKALKELWNPLFIVGFGEIEDGAFGSLAVGATSVLFDDLWNEAQSIDQADAETELRNRLGEKSLFYRQFLKFKQTPMKRAITPTHGFIRYEDLVKK